MFRKQLSDLRAGWVSECWYFASVGSGFRISPVLVVFGGGSGHGPSDISPVLVLVFAVLAGVPAVGCLLVLHQVAFLVLMGVLVLSAACKLYLLSRT
jgi:hypothetical protein